MNSVSGFRKHNMFSLKGEENNGPFMFSRWDTDHVMLRRGDDSGVALFIIPATLDGIIIHLDWRAEW